MSNSSAFLRPQVCCVLWLVLTKSSLSGSSKSFAIECCVIVCLVNDIGMGDRRLADMSIVDHPIKSRWSFEDIWLRGRMMWISSLLPLLELT